MTSEDDEDEFESMLTDLLHLVHFRIPGTAAGALLDLDVLLDPVAVGDDPRDELELDEPLELEEVEDCVGLAIGRCGE